MPSVYWSWFNNQELPGIEFEHLDNDGAAVDLSSGWTFTAQLVNPATNAIVVTQTDNMTGASTLPNFTVNRWSTTTLTAITTDLGATKTKVYELRPYLRRTSDSADEVPTSVTPKYVEFKLAAT